MPCFCSADRCAIAGDLVTLSCPDTDLQRGVTPTVEWWQDEVPIPSDSGLIIDGQLHLRAVSVDQDGNMYRCRSSTNDAGLTTTLRVQGKEMLIE